MSWDELESKYIATSELNHIYYEIRDLLNEHLGLESKHICASLNSNIYDTYLLLTEQCNLRCAYCFEQHNSSKSHKLMNRDTIISALNWIETLDVDSNVMLFGGEPTLNVDAFTTIYEYIKDRIPDKIKGFKLQTNLFVLDNDLINILNLINDRVPLEIVVSLDGTKISHDACRVDVNGNGTYDIILSNARLLRTKCPNMKISYHCTLSPNTINEWFDTILNCKNLMGVFDYGFVGIDDVDMNDTKLTKDQLRPIFKYYYDNVAGLEKFYSETFLSIFESVVVNPFRSTAPSICGAGFKSFAIKPNGDIIPCHKYLDTRNGDFALGNVNSVDNINTDKYFNNYNNISKDKVIYSKFRDHYCSDCVLNNECKGCTGSNEIIGGDISIKSSNVCARTKMLAELAIEYRLPWLRREIDRISQLVGDLNEISDRS